MNYNLDNELQKSLSETDNDLINLSKGFPWMITIGNDKYDPKKDCIGVFLNRQFAIARKACVKTLDMTSLRIRYWSKTFMRKLSYK